MDGPGTQYLYNGYGNIEFEGTKKQYKNIGIITHSTGISTTYSLIESIIMNYDNRTGVTLLWLGDKAEDFIFIDEFTSYV